MAQQHLIYYSLSMFYYAYAVSEEKWKNLRDLASQDSNMGILNKKMGRFKL